MSEQEQRPSQRLFVLNNEALPTEFNQPYDQVAFDKTPDGTIQIIGYKSLSEEDYVKAYGYDPEDVPAPQAEPEKLSENPEIAQLQQVISDLRKQIQELTQTVEQLSKQLAAQTSDASPAIAAAEALQSEKLPPPKEPLYDLPVSFTWEKDDPVTVMNGDKYETDWHVKSVEPDGRIIVAHTTGMNEDSLIVADSNKLSRWYWDRLSEDERRAEIEKYGATVRPLSAVPETEVAYVSAKSPDGDTETIVTTTPPAQTYIGPEDGPSEIVVEKQSLRDRLTDNRNRVGIGVLGALGLIGLGGLLVELWEHKFTGHSPTREVRQAISTNTVVPRYDKTFQNTVLGQLGELKRSVRAEISADNAHEAADKARAAADKARDLHAHRHDLDAINGVLKADHRDHAQMLRNLHHGSGYETIGYDGDSVMDDVRRKLTWQLGYSPTKNQTREATDAVLKINHETWDTIKSKSIGYRYRMPANLVHYISR